MSSEAAGASDGDSIKVFVRVRPPMTGQVEVDPGLCLRIGNDDNSIVMQSKLEPKVFKFDQVADMYTTQETVFSSVGKRLIESCVEGYNGTIFAYGQTGSGKTFTMLGPAEGTDNFQHELRGVIPRSFDYLFTLMKREMELQGDKVQFLCKCSFLEIYNEQIFDLLDGTASTGLLLRENIKRGVFVDGLTERAVTNSMEAYEVLSSGWMHRTVASTSMNRESSRSHAVFTVNIESKTMNNGVWNVKSSYLNLVDLAGSERQKDTQTVGVRLKEASSINLSLSALGNVIMALGDVAHGKSRYVPYRDSKLSFLLRDSLGGNAKTFIIACVHPGSKCFGETMSTLQFARRAKLIKTKAVKNEDAYGSLTHMQTEIKRLKEVIAQLQQGQTLSSVDTSAEGMEEGGQAEDAKLWRQSFLQAMFLREKVTLDKKTIQEKYQGLQETCSRKDQALRQNRMVLKFREEALKKLEKAAKQNRELQEDEENSLIETMRKEINTLSEINNHHPDVTRLRLENDSLKGELRRMRGESSVTNIDKDKARDLERRFRDLLADHEGQIPCYTTPKQSADSAVAVATLDRQKSQIEKLQAELDTVNRALTEEKERAQKALMEKEAELVAVSRGREEMEKALKAHHVNAQIERETREDMHRETIKTMTTPKKAAYQLRTRTIMAPISGALQMFDLDESLTESITSEPEPTQLVEERTDALMEQIKKLQEANRYLTTQHENREADIIKQVEEVSKLESQNKQLSELYEKEKSEWTSKVKSLQSEMEKVSKQERDNSFDNQILQSEVDDLRIVSSSLEKRNTELQGREKKLQEEKERRVGKLETQVLKMETELERMKKEMSLSLEEQDRLRESEENLQATLAFSQDRLADLETQLSASIRENKELEAVHKLSRSRLEQLELKNQQLTSQLEEHGDKEQQLLKSLQEVDRLRDELEMKDNELQAINTTKQMLQSEYETLCVERNTLLKKDQDNMEVMNVLRGKLSEQKKQLLDNENQLETLRTQLEDSRQQVATLQTEQDSLAQMLQESENTYQEEVERLNIEISKKNVEAEMAREDFDAQQQQLDDFTQEIQELQEEKGKLHTKIDSLSAQLTEAKERVGKQTQVLEKMSRDSEKTTEEKDAELATSRAELLEATCKLQRAEQKLFDLHAAFDVISGQLQDYMSQCTDLQTQLKTEKLEVSQLQQQSNDWQHKYNSLHLIYQIDEDNWHQKENSQKEEAWLLRSRADEADASAALAEQKWNQLLNQNQELQDCLDVMGVKQVENDTEQQRLRELIEAKNEEYSQLDSRLKELEENLLHSTKEREQWELKFNVVSEENVKLAGHQNPHQKIHYTHSLKEQNNKLREELKQANRELQKLKHRIPVQSKVMLGIGTPERQHSLERKGTPGAKNGSATPTGANHTPSRFDKNSALNERNAINVKENVLPEL